MAKLRVYELAKELNVESKEIIAMLSSDGIEVKSASSGLEEDICDKVRKTLGGGADKAEMKTAAKKADDKKVEDKKAEEKKAAEKKPADKKPEAKPAQKEADAKKAGEKSDKKDAPKASGVSEKKPKTDKKHSGDKAAKSKDAEAGKKGEKKLAPKKKKSVVFNLGNSSGGGARRPRGDGRRPRQGGDSRRGPIRVRDGVEAPSVVRARREAEEARRREAANAASNTPEGVKEASESSAARRDPKPARPAREGAGRSARGANRPAGEERRNVYKKSNSSEINKNAPDSGKPNTRRGGKSAKRGGRDSDKLGKKEENYRNLEKNGGVKPKKPQKKAFEKSDEIRTVSIPERLTIREFSDRIKVPASDIIKKLFMKNILVTVNHDIEYDMAEEIALEYNIITEVEEKVDVIAELLKDEEDDEKSLKMRPPVVCVMGHVDHGKTSLLDAIRDTKVTDREAGGITQHIGAYMVPVNGQKITFLDTPGHEAFTAMRMRGANSTDIAILVVAADDGVMPQTVEAINHAKAADIEIIVAINKIDKPGANIERVKQELSEYELVPEDWGGNTVFCPVSAHTGEGIDNLLEMILLTAEVLELKANPKRNARGLVIEAKLDKGRGTVATVLVQKGTLKVGDPISAGAAYGKVRAMVDENGKRLKTAGPSTPVEIIGLSEVPNAGEIFMAMDSEKDAHSFADTFVAESKNKMVEDSRVKMSLDDLFSQIQTGNLKELNLIVKADVQGSVEAVKQSLVKLSNDEVVVKVIHGGVGAINESDVILASASNAIIIGFNVRPDAIAKETSDREGVEIKLYKVIYNAIEDVEAAMKGMLEPIYEEQIIGHAEIRQIFKSSEVGNIAGSYVLDGKLERGCKVRINRGDDMIFEGDLASLKRFKDDVKEVKAGYECGLVFEGFDAIQEEDVVEGYVMVEVER